MESPKIVTNKSELILMFTRLAIAIEERPDDYKWTNPEAYKNIEQFYIGENHRRDLENPGRTFPQQNENNHAIKSN